MAEQHPTLSPSPSPARAAEQANLPCYVLPSTNLSRFYGRDDILAQIDRIFHPDSGTSGFSSIALHGIGGVGKSHVALKYAHTMIASGRASAVLWFDCRTESTFAQSLWEAAIRLGVWQGDKDDIRVNRVAVLGWLQKAHCPWLLVFDGLENTKRVASFWPSECTTGSVLITSRNHSVGFRLADHALEIPPFTVDSGSQFLLHCLRVKDLGNGDQADQTEFESARKVSESFSGHPLAISHAADWIQERSWSIAEFLEIYGKNKGHFHYRGPKSHVLSSIWAASFHYKYPNSCKHLLTILTFLNTDEVPEQLFRGASEEAFNPDFGNLDTCASEIGMSNLLEPLLSRGLIKRNKDTKALSAHSLIRKQFWYYL
ncbi:P-loop containing nucleoside triphosphate hydrolase protein, partial [Naviculisporaceae sp. PSN 640]